MKTLLEFRSPRSDSVPWASLTCQAAGGTSSGTRGVSLCRKCARWKISYQTSPSCRHCSEFAMRKRASGVPVSQLRHRTTKRRGREKVFPLKIYVNADTKVGRIFHLVPGRVDPEETPSLIRRTCFSQWPPMLSVLTC